MVDTKKLKRLLNQIVVTGSTKKSFFRKSIPFELQVYYTPVKNKIMFITITGVELDHPKLFIDFKVGDNIKLVINWIEKYEHKIIFERNRLEN